MKSMTLRMAGFSFSSSDKCEFGYNVTIIITIIVRGACPLADEVLSKELVLDTTETVLRKYGPAKTNMSDIARALDVTHAALYRLYSNKAALKEAVVERWLERSLPPLQAVASEASPASERLYRWLDTLRKFKRNRASQDPELFEMYSMLVEEAPEAIRVHRDHLLDQLTAIIEDGIQEGTIAKQDARAAANAVFTATAAFHHVAHAAEWELSDWDSRFEAVWRLISVGLFTDPSVSSRSKMKL
ncbi:TetR family transcriptional regulator [Paenibacillus barengoltzii]|uniref:TetR family transcriptional regulator n=1 Tax=Paenibacillus barengoltzii TaxID=343517 RepID=UPI002DB6FD6B|nr:TetR family transcriptional regulator [Paenibacillus barengoltzii]MEC2343670.1 TetR family transcriptional regulator [Paenibacillus barengoltzii]